MIKHKVQAWTKTVNYITIKYIFFCTKSSKAVDVIAPELCNILVLDVSQYISHVVSCHSSTKCISVTWPWLTQIRAVYSPHVTKNISLSFSMPRDRSLLHITLSWFNSSSTCLINVSPPAGEPVFKVWLGSQWQEDTASDWGPCVKQHWLHLMTTPPLLC